MSPNEQSLRVQVEITGSQKCQIVGKSQSVITMISPMIFTRTRTVVGRYLRRAAVNDALPPPPPLRAEHTGGPTPDIHAFPRRHDY
jgi:hypothetical protein